MASLSEALAAARAEFDVVIADTPALRLDAYRLRHQVYCRERAFESVDGDIETDEFDCRAPHVVICRKDSGMVVAAARLVLPRHAGRPADLPMHRLCRRDLLDHLPASRTAEVSRFAVSKERRGLSTAATALLRMGLVQGVVRLSRLHGITHWAAVMEPTLLRLLQASSIRFTPVGPLVEHHGVRQPSHAEIADVLDRMEDEQPELWGYVTEGSQRWPTRLRMAEAMAA